MAAAAADDAAADDHYHVEFIFTVISSCTCTDRMAVCGLDNGALCTIPLGGAVRFDYDLEDHGKIFACRFSHDQTRLATTGMDQMIRIWCSRTGRCLSRFFHVHMHSRFCAFSHDDVLVAVASVDHLGQANLIIWDTHTVDHVRILQGHTGRITCCDFSRDGARLVTGSEDKTVRIWDARAYACLHAIRDVVADINDCVFSPDSTLLMIASNASNACAVSLWTVHARLVRTFLGHGQGSVTSCDISSDGMFAVTGGEDTTIRVWDMGTGECLNVLHEQGPVAHCMFVPGDSSAVVSCCSQDMRVLEITHRYGPVFYPQAMIMILIGKRFGKRLGNAVALPDELWDWMVDNRFI